MRAHRTGPRLIAASLVLGALMLWGGCAAGVQAVPAAPQQDDLLRHLLADADSVRAPAHEAYSNPPAPQGEGALAVEPRPLRRYNEPGDSREPWFAVNDSATTRRRAATILATGHDTARAIPFPRCPERRFSDSARAGCPAATELRVAFGRLESVPDSGSVTVRVQWFELDPRGQRIWEYRYRLRRVAGAWVTMDRRLIGVLG